MRYVAQPPAAPAFRGSQTDQRPAPNLHLNSEILRRPYELPQNDSFYCGAVTLSACPPVWTAKPDRTNVRREVEGCLRSVAVRQVRRPAPAFDEPNMECPAFCGAASTQLKHSKVMERSGQALTRTTSFWVPSRSFGIGTKNLVWPQNPSIELDR